MKKSLLSTVILLMFYTLSAAAEGNLIPYYDGKKWGFCDINSKIIVKPQYDYCSDMIDGIAWVKKNSLFGFVNSAGKEIIAPVYSDIHNFKGGFVSVGKDEKYGVINSRGEFYIPLSDFYINSFNGSVAVISKNYIYGLMGKGGKIIVQPVYQRIDVLNASTFIAVEPNKTNTLMTGRNVLINNNGEKSGKSYDLIYPLDSGFSKIRDNKKWGYLDPAGKEIVPPLYDDIRNIKPDGTSCFLKNGKWGIINGKGIIIKEPLYEDVGGGNSFYDELFHYGEKFFPVYLNNSWGTVSLTGEVLAGPVYSMIGFCKSDYVPAYRPLTKDDSSSATGLTVLDSGGKEAFEPVTSFNNTGQVSDGLLAVADRAGKWGYISIKGETVIKPEYEKALEFNGGFAVVKKDGRYGVINRKNEVVEKFEFNELKAADNYPGLYEGEISGVRVFLKPGSFHYWKK